MLVKLLERLEPGQAIASMGYPDIIVPPDWLARVLGERIEHLRYRPDSEVICRRHGAKAHDVPDAESLFDAFGCSLDVYDIAAERGGEIVLDLNHPFPENSREQYDYVLDVGTLEHCFNVAQAAMNMAGLVMVGGQIFHENPWNWGNHGFYGINPTWFHDFYTDNGFEIEECRIMLSGFRSGPAPQVKRFNFTSEEMVLGTIARRVASVGFRFPTQSKYRSKT